MSTIASPKSGDTSSGRMAWIDIARGLGIILVVYGHVLRGNVLAVEPTGWAARQDLVIYAFHMPLFFMLAGLFLWQSVGKGKLRFTKDRWWQMIYPYLLWSVVTALTELAFAQWVNTPISWNDLLFIPINPIEQYWFLYALLIAQMIAVLVYPRKWLLVLAGIAGLSAVPLPIGPWILSGALVHLPYVIFGVLCAAVLQSQVQASMARAAMMATGGWIVFALLELNPVAEGVQAYLLGLSGCLGTIGVAAVMANSAMLAPPLVQLGQASLAIYLSHSIISAGTRIALKIVGIAPQSSVSLALCTVLGLLVPYFLWRWAVAAGWNRWLGFGGKAAAIDAGHSLPGERSA